EGLQPGTDLGRWASEAAREGPRLFSRPLAVLGVVGRDVVDRDKDHVYDNKGPRPADTSAAVHQDRTCVGYRLLAGVHVVEEIEHTARVRRDTMIWPCLETIRSLHLEKCSMELEHLSSTSTQAQQYILNQLSDKLMPKHFHEGKEGNHSRKTIHETPGGNSSHDYLVNSKQDKTRMTSLPACPLLKVSCVIHLLVGITREAWVYKPASCCTNND
ncbi:unnamed protein product, partial [Timema podura]|nr:unnamed protein product [Timema podura]